jgi:mannose-1-phosphate guanylyltransferase
MSKVEGDNVVIDSKVELEDCRNNVIKLPKGKIGVFNGLEGYIVADSDDVLLVCKKNDDSSLIRKYASEIGLKYGDGFV